MTLTKAEADNCTRHEQEIGELYRMQRDTTAAIAEQTKSVAILQQVVNTLHDTVQMLLTDVIALKGLQSQQQGSKSTTAEVLRWVALIIGWCIAIGFGVVNFLK